MDYERVSGLRATLEPSFQRARSGGTSVVCKLDEVEEALTALVYFIEREGLAGPATNPEGVASRAQSIACQGCGRALSEEVTMAMLRGAALRDCPSCGSGSCKLTVDLTGSAAPASAPAVTTGSVTNAGPSTTAALATEADRRLAVMTVGLIVVTMVWAAIAERVGLGVAATAVIFAGMLIVRRAQRTEETILGKRRRITRSIRVLDGSQRECDGWEYARYPALFFHPDDDDWAISHAPSCELMLTGRRDLDDALELAELWRDNDIDYSRPDWQTDQAMQLRALQLIEDFEARATSQQHHPEPPAAPKVDVADPDVVRAPTDDRRTSGVAPRASSQNGSGSTERQASFKQGRLLKTFEHASEMTALALSANGSVAVSGDYDGVVRVWDLSTGECTVLEGHSGPVAGVALTPDGSIVSMAHQLIEWDLEDCTPLYTVSLDVEPWAATSRMALTSDGAKVVLAAPNAMANASDCEVRIWDRFERRWAHGRPQADTVEPRAPKFMPTVAVTSADRLAITTSEHALRVWSIETGQVEREIPVDFLATHLALSSDGRLAVIGSPYNGWQAWSLEAGSFLGKFGSAAGGATLTSDNRFALVGGFMGPLHVYELPGLREVGTLEGHEDSVDAVAISADDRTVVTGARDSTLRVWRLEWTAETAPGSTVAGVA